VTRSMSASKLTVLWRLYSCSRAKIAWMPGSGGRSGAVVAIAWMTSRGDRRIGRGIDALNRFFDSMPADSGLAFVVFHPRHHSELALCW
jgi:hypothetical protein